MTLTDCSRICRTCLMHLLISVRLFLRGVSLDLCGASTGSASAGGVGKLACVASKRGGCTVNVLDTSDALGAGEASVNDAVGVLPMCKAAVTRVPEHGREQSAHDLRFS
jgi:hypothetical protein